MGGREDVERPVERPRGLEEGDRPPQRQLVPQRAPGEELHDEERATGAQLPVVVDGDGVRVPEAGRQPRLPPEPGDRAPVGEVLGADHLHRRVAIAADVAGRVDGPHPPFPEPAVEPVALGEEPGNRLRHLHGVPVGGADQVVLVRDAAAELALVEGPAPAVLEVTEDLLADAAVLVHLPRQRRPLEREGDVGSDGPQRLLLLRDEPLARPLGADRDEAERLPRPGEERQRRRKAGRAELVGELPLGVRRVSAVRREGVEGVARLEGVGQRQDRRPVQRRDVGEDARGHGPDGRSRRLECEDPEGLAVGPVRGGESVEDDAGEVLARVLQVPDDVRHELRRVVDPLAELPVERGLRPLPERVEDEEEEDGHERRGERPLQGGRDEGDERREGRDPGEEEDDEGAGGDRVGGAPPDEPVDLEEPEARRGDDEGDRQEDGEGREGGDRQQRGLAGQGRDVAQEDVEAEVDEDGDEQDARAPPHVLPAGHPGEGEEVDEHEEVDRERDDRDRRPQGPVRRRRAPFPPPRPQVERERDERERRDEDVRAPRPLQPCDREEAPDRQQDPGDGHEVDRGRAGEGDPVRRRRPEGDRPEDPPGVEDPVEREEREQRPVRRVERPLEEDDDAARVVDGEDEQGEPEAGRVQRPAFDPGLGQEDDPGQGDGERQAEGREDDPSLAGLEVSHERRDYPLGGPACGRPTARPLSRPSRASRTTAPSGSGRESRAWSSPAPTRGRWSTSRPTRVPVSTSTGRLPLPRRKRRRPSARATTAELPSKRSPWSVRGSTRSGVLGSRRRRRRDRLPLATRTPGRAPEARSAQRRSPDPGGAAARSTSLAETPSSA